MIGVSPEPVPHPYLTAIIAPFVPSLVGVTPLHARALALISHPSNEQLIISNHLKILLLLVVGFQPF